MKKTTLTITLLMIVMIAFGQDTTFYNSDMKVINKRDSAKYYKIIRHSGPVVDKNVEKTYYMSGQLYILDPYSDFTPRVREGKYKSFYENGQIYKDIDYFVGKLDGTCLIYWPDGKIKRQDEYQDGKLIKGKCFTRDGKDTTFYSYESVCDFPGGENKMMEYLKKEITFPQKDKENGVQGTVYLTFMVEKDGSITDIKVIRGLSEGTDEESIRVVKKMPKWKPAMHEGEPYRMQWNLPIKFMSYK